MGSEGQERHKVGKLEGAGDRVGSEGGWGSCGLRRRGEASGGLRRTAEAWWWASSRVLGIVQAQKEAGDRSSLWVRGWVELVQASVLHVWSGWVELVGQGVGRAVVAGVPHVWSGGWVELVQAKKWRWCVEGLKVCKVKQVDQ